MVFPCRLIRRPSAQLEDNCGPCAQASVWLRRSTTTAIIEPDGRRWRQAVSAPRIGLLAHDGAQVRDLWAMFRRPVSRNCVGLSHVERRGLHHQHLRQGIRGRRRRSTTRRTTWSSSAPATWSHAAWAEPSVRLDHRAGLPDWPAEVVLPDGPPRPLGLGPAEQHDRLQHEDGRADDQEQEGQEGHQEGQPERYLPSPTWRSTAGRAAERKDRQPPATKVDQVNVPQDTASGVNTAATQSIPQTSTSWSLQRAGFRLEERGQGRGVLELEVLDLNKIVDTT